MQKLRLGGAIGIVDRDPMSALRDETPHQLLVQCFAGDDDTRYPGGPEIDEMRLTAAGWPIQR